MFELCDHLVGIYKTFNCTKSLTIDPRIYDKETTVQENGSVDIQNNVAELNNEQVVTNHVLANESEVSETSEQEENSVINDSIEMEQSEIESTP